MDRQKIHSIVKVNLTEESEPEDRVGVGLEHRQMDRLKFHCIVKVNLTRAGNVEDRQTEYGRGYVIMTGSRFQRC